MRAVLRELAAVGVVLAVFVGGMALAILISPFPM